VAVAAAVEVATARIVAAPDAVAAAVTVEPATWRTSAVAVAAAVAVAVPEIVPLLAGLMAMAAVMQYTVPTPVNVRVPVAPDAVRASVAATERCG
jgi:hypothetical protein